MTIVQPIKTAPKGERILVFLQQNSTDEGYWQCGTFDEDSGRWMDDGWPDYLILTPTYWLPLPPTKQLEEARCVNSPAEALLVEERLRNQALTQTNYFEREETFALRCKVLELHAEIQQLKKEITGLNAIVAAHELMRSLKIKMTENADTPQSVIEILNTNFQDLV